MTRSPVSRTSSPRQALSKPLLGQLCMQHSLLCPASYSFPTSWLGCIRVLLSSAPYLKHTARQLHPASELEAGCMQPGERCSTRCRARPSLD